MSNGNSNTSSKKIDKKPRMIVDDDDVIYIESKSKKIEIITLSDDELEPKRFEGNEVKGEVVSKEQVLNDYISPLQLLQLVTTKKLLKNPFSAKNNVIKSVAEKKKKTKKNKKNGLVPKKAMSTKQYNILQKNSRKNNKAALNESQVQSNISAEKPTSKVLVTHLSKDNDANIELTTKEFENLKNHSNDKNENVLNELQTTQVQPNTLSTYKYTSTTELLIQKEVNNLQECSKNINEYHQVQSYMTTNTTSQQQSADLAQDPLLHNKFSEEEYFDPLLSVIVEEQYPDVKLLTDCHLLILRKLVGFEIDNVIASEHFIPRFKSSYVKSGVILVRSADFESQQWLQSIIPTLNPEQGIKLKIVSPQDLDKLYRISICILHDTSVFEILIRLQRQNPDVNMRSWQLYTFDHLSGERSGVILHMAIPEYSTKILECKNYKLHYGLYEIEVEMKDSI